MYFHLINLAIYTVFLGALTYAAIQLMAPETAMTLTTVHAAALRNIINNSSGAPNLHANATISSSPSTPNAEMV